METAMDLNLKPFCEFGRAGRLKLDTPFVKDGWMYATDGRICIRIPCDGPNDTDNRPDAASLFEGFDPSMCACPWGDTPAEVANQPCPSCDENGWVPDEDGDPTRCVMCAGLGWLHMELPRRINGIMIANVYDRLIRSLPGVLTSKFDKPMTTKMLHMIRFIFDGGQGALMGLKEAETN